MIFIFSCKKTPFFNVQSWVGIMLVKQPFFIGGIESVEDAKGSAFGAAGMFFFTFLASILYLIRDSRRVNDMRVAGGPGGGGSSAGGGGGGSVSSSQHSGSGGGGRQEPEPDIVFDPDQGPSYAMHRTRSSGSLTRRVRGDIRAAVGAGEYGKVSVFEEYDQSEDNQMEPLQSRGGYLS
jgi:hypothetical protein